MWYSLTGRVSFSLVLVSILMSCTLLRTHPDTACAKLFVDSYPEPGDSRFVLPWQVGKSYVLTQGNCTLESHSLVEKQHMSFDFRMPIGTPIHAIEDGRVAAVIENFGDNVDNKFDQANLVALEHNGGILSWYMHLQNEGVVVEVDDYVQQGELIAYSGNTGNSAYPHLHIYAQQLVTECHDAKNRTAKLDLCPQIPISFLNASPQKKILKEWEKYTALPY